MICRKGCLEGDDEMPEKENKPKETEQVHNIPLSEIRPFRNHPFKISDDELMQQTVDSIMQVGILNPVIIRPDPGGGYEMVSGHRRMRAAEIAGLESIPAIVRSLTDDEAVILMVDSNLQREIISPMERAKAYKMKLEALKHQGKRVDLEDKSTSAQLEQKSRWSVERVAEDANESRAQVQRYIRLTELLPEIQTMVDNKEIAFSPAVELSYLKPEDQKQFLDAMDYSQNTPSLSQAQRLKKLSREGKCTQQAMYDIMSEEKKDELDRITLKGDVLRQYFPREYTPIQMQNTIIKLLEAWQRKRQREIER
jgi:ParB family chromosome partitioning protein